MKVLCTCLDIEPSSNIRFDMRQNKNKRKFIPIFEKKYTSFYKLLRKLHDEPTFFTCSPICEFLYKNKIGSFTKGNFFFNFILWFNSLFCQFYSFFIPKISFDSNTMQCAGKHWQNNTKKNLYFLFFFIWILFVRKWKDQFNPSTSTQKHLIQITKTRRTMTLWIIYWSLYMCFYTIHGYTGCLFAPI